MLAPATRSGSLTPATPAMPAIPATATWRPAAARPSGFLPFALLLVFLLLLFANLPLMFPALAALAPAQGVAVAALLLLFFERTVSRQPFRLVWPESHVLLAFLAVAGLSCLFALWTGYAVANTLLVVRYVAIYFLLVDTVASWGRLMAVYGVLAAGALFPTLGAIHNSQIHNLVEGSRVAWIGIFSSPNDLAFAMTVLFPLVLALALAVSGWRRLLLLGVAATQAAAIFLSYSRGGLLGFSVVLLLCLLGWAARWVRLPALAILALAVFAWLPTYWGREQGFSDLRDDPTVQERLDTIVAGWRMFEDRPLLGVGPGCSEVGWPIYAPHPEIAQDNLHVHNTYVQALGETGLLGFLLFALLLGCGVVKAHRLARVWRRHGERPFRLVSALEISLAGLLVCGFSGGYVLTWFPYLVLALVSAAQRLPLPAALPAGE
jgi:putative inorganic carbon (hco3(-)) transporter